MEKYIENFIENTVKIQHGKKTIKILVGLSNLRLFLHPLWKGTPWNNYELLYKLYIFHKGQIKR